MDDDLVQFLRARLDEDEKAARTASHALRKGAHWSLDEWHGREQPHSLIAQGTADQPVALGHFTADPVPTEQAVHIARHDPVRVLAEVAAKREIVGLHHRVTKRSTGSGGGTVEDCSLCDHFPAQYPCMTLRLLALPYASHPNYNETWRP